MKKYRRGLHTNYPAMELFLLYKYTPHPRLSLNKTISSIADLAHNSHISPMRIRGRNPAAPGCSVSLSSPSPSPSPSPSSSISSYSSSITAAISSASSQDSSNSCSHPSSHRWHGLDLLVKAIHQVTAGSVIGVPYIQRRVTTRRRRRRRVLDSDVFVFDGLSQRRNAMKVGGDEKKKKVAVKQKIKKGKKEMGLPIAIQDSVLHSWVGRSDLAGEVGS